MHYTSKHRLLGTKGSLLGLSQPAVHLILTYAYGYSTSGWGDLLTTFKGRSITYDAVGNSKDFRWPNTHFWESPEPERWYPLA